MYTSNNANNPAPIMPEYGYQYPSPNYGQCYGYMGYGRDFILIVVLFILLIIVGATIL